MRPPFHWIWFLGICYAVTVDTARAISVDDTATSMTKPSTTFPTETTDNRTVIDEKIETPEVAGGTTTPTIDPNDIPTKEVGQTPDKGIPLPGTNWNRPFRPHNTVGNGCPYVGDVPETKDGIEARASASNNPQPICTTDINGKQNTCKCDKEPKTDENCGVSWAACTAPSGDTNIYTLNGYTFKYASDCAYGLNTYVDNTSA